MNSTLMRAIAIALAIGAIVTAWLGYRLSTQASTPQLPQVQITHPQLVATRELPAGQILTPADVQVENLPQRHPAALTTAEPAVGKLTLMPINKGSPILASYFPSTSPVAQSLQPHERAVAIKVNEVIGVGGFVKPGDHVDVLLFLRADRETSDISSAQVVLNNVRILAYGDDVAQSVNNVSSTPGADNSVLEQGATKLETMKAKEGKSAILAIPRQDTARLMLAENSGILKLALRGASLPNAGEQATESHFVQLKDMGKPAAEPVVRVVADEPVSSAKKITRTSRENEGQVIVHHGDKVEIVKVRQ
ncbi:MAG TPA: Flp pilus assembly protein CpaB [Methylophilaceae bacterium]|nr:Flp pilus assembly protein CpaB [Methylophilaceae bacterium]